jgi:hypothetical protein
VVGYGVVRGVGVVRVVHVWGVGYLG